MNVEALQTKYPIIDSEIYTEGTRKYWKIIRVGNHTEVHHFFDDMLKAFNKDDLVMLWSLVKEKFNSTEPTDDKEREIWVKLKRLFEPDTDDKLWKLQKHIHDLTWKIYYSCRVHHVSTEKGIDIYMLVEKELKDQEDEVFRRIVSENKKCFVDKPLAIPLDEIQIDVELNFIEEPVEIIDREVKQLKHSHIPIVKVELLEEENVFTPVTDSYASNLTPIDCMERVSFRGDVDQRLLKRLDDEIPRNRILVLRRDILGVAKSSRWVEAKMVSSEVESEKWGRLPLH
ncbi:hypothetical protein Tco_0520721 [Tanacetum coccineum]